MSRQEFFLPEIIAGDDITSWLASCCARPGALLEIERKALAGPVDDPALHAEPWLSFARRVRDLWSNHDHVVIRGVPEQGDGVALMLVSLALSRRFKLYRNDKVVKQFRMSPWTTELSHTLKDGHFHTDINTAPEPPVITAIQCKVPDPGAPRYGQLRVSRWVHLLDWLRRHQAMSTVAFLEATDVTMVNEMSPGGWTGRIVTDGCIRFHPETIRAGQHRYGTNPPEFETHLEIIHEAALATSTPIHLEAGAVLLVSNTRALHYRGECSVVFQNFPRAYTSREIYALHTLDEPA